MALAAKLILTLAVIVIGLADATSFWRCRLDDDRGGDPKVAGRFTMRTRRGNKIMKSEYESPLAL